jgi:hypothetical protein
MNIRKLAGLTCVLALSALNCSGGNVDGPISGDESVAQTEQALTGAVLYVAGSTTLNASDTALRNRLQTLGLSVTVKAASSTTSADATGKALVVISSTVTSGDVGSKFKSVTVPVLDWESSIYDDMALTPASGSLGTQGAQTQVSIATPSHPIANGLTGTQTVASSSTFSWGKPGAAAVKVANLPSDASKSLIFTYDKGAALVDGTPAPARRVGFFLEDNTAVNLTTTGWNLFNQAVTWAVAAPSVSNSVKLTVSGVDDFLYVWVDGVRRKVYGWGQGDTDLDVSSWFGNGSNTVRIQAVNTGGPVGYSVQLTVNGSTVINASCFTEPCGGLPAGAGIVFDQTYSVNTPFGLARQNLTATGVAGGKLYLNDQFTGLTVPTTLSLPQGTYTLGLGSSNDTPGAHTGAFYERTVVLGNAAQSVNVSQNAPLATPNHTSVAILPIRTAIHGAGGPSDTGVLIDSDISTLNSQAIAAREQYLKPFSYGLTTWDITVLPTVESTPLYRAADPGAAPDTGRFLNEAGLNSLNSQYDMVVFLYSKFKADGTDVADSPCCFWGGGQAISFMNFTTRPASGYAVNYPNVYLLHESFHAYDSYSVARLFKYTGADSTHGSDEHGYLFGDDGEDDFVAYYRDYERGQVKELKNMRVGVTWPSRPTTSDLLVGEFDVMRHDVNWNAAFAKFQVLADRVAPSSNVTCALKP